MNRIRGGQLCTILFLSGVWQVLCIRNTSGNAVPGVLLAFGIQLLLTLPMLHLSGRNISFGSVISGRKWLGGVYILFFLLWGAYGFAEFRDVSPMLHLPVSGTVTAVLLVILTCIYACSKGLTAAARAGNFVLAVLVISGAVLFFGAYSHMEPDRVQVQYSGSVTSGLRYLCMGGELTAAWVLSDRTRGSRRRVVWGYLAAKCGFTLFVLFLCISTAGRLAELSEYPVFLIAAISQPLQEQRADALYIFAWVMTFVMHITLQTGVTSHIAAVMFPGLKGSSLLSLGGMLALSFLPMLGETSLLFGSLLLLTAFLLPLLCCIRRKEGLE